MEQQAKQDLPSLWTRDFTIITVGIFCLLEAMPDILKEQG